MGKVEIRSTQGLLNAITEGSYHYQPPLTRKMLEETIKELEKCRPSEEQYAWLTYGDVLAFHEEGLLEFFLQTYIVCIGSDSWEFIKLHYDEHGKRKS